MWILLLLLLIFLFVFVLPLLILFVIPLGVTLHSLVVLVTTIPQLWAVARDRRRRRNHALEHATVHVLEARAGRPLPINGLADVDGFRIIGALTPELLLDAAQEALERLQRGEHHLAWHPRCGTTLVAGQLLFAIVILGFLIFRPEWFILGLVLASLVALSLARPFSLLLQRWVTTDTNVRHLVVVHAAPVMPSSFLSAFLMFSSGGLMWKVYTVEQQPVDRPHRGNGHRYRAY